MPDVSVIIPVYNNADTITEQLDALARQTFDGDIEILVSDNGSTDDTVARVKASVHPVRVIDASDKKGAAHARNVAAREAQAPILLFCDGDDRVYPDWISELAALCQANDVVAGALESESISSPRACRWSPLPAPARQAGENFLPLGAGASFGAKTSVWHALGGMDETYIATEDVEFLWRAQLAGYSFAFSPKPLVAYRLRETLGGLLTQSRSRGYHTMKLVEQYRTAGHPPFSLLVLMSVGATIVFRNPLLPRAITRFDRGDWVRQVGTMAGVAAGVRKFRALTIQRVK